MVAEGQVCDGQTQIRPLEWKLALRMQNVTLAVFSMRDEMVWISNGKGFQKETGLRLWTDSLLLIICMPSGGFQIKLYQVSLDKYLIIELGNVSGSHRRG